MKRTAEMNLRKCFSFDPDFATRAIMSSPRAIDASSVDETRLRRDNFEGRKVRFTLHLCGQRAQQVVESERCEDSPTMDWGVGMGVENRDEWRVRSIWPVENPHKIRRK
jgi:hypothetical protein